MHFDLTQLVVVLKEEITVGEELHRNLEAQKKAIVVWDVVSLLEQIDARESWVRSLSELEEKRSEILNRISSTNGPMTFRQIIATLPLQGSERILLGQLRERTRKVFTRLQAEERSLHELMQSLLAHIQGALTSLVDPLVPIYSESGITPPPRTRSGLLHGKA